MVTDNISAKKMKTHRFCLTLHGHYKTTQTKQEKKHVEKGVEAWHITFSKNNFTLHEQHRTIQTRQIIEEKKMRGMIMA